MLEFLSAMPMDIIQFLAKAGSGATLQTSDNFCEKTLIIWQFVGQIVNVMKIIIPVIIVLLGTIDLGKAVMAGEDKKIKEAQKMLLMRIIYGVAIFFVVVIVQIIFGMVSGAENQADDNYNKCLACVSKPNANSCKGKS